MNKIYISNSDLIIMALYPEDTISFIEANIHTLQAVLLQIFVG